MGSSPKNNAIEAIAVAYDEVLKTLALTVSQVGIDINIVNHIAARYSMDVERIHNYHDIPRLDCHKIAGYLTYWICRLRPIYVTDRSVYETNGQAATVLNELLALYTGVGRIVSSDNFKKGNKKPNLKENFLQPFLYTLRNRPLNADLLSFIYYFVDEVC